MAQNRIANGDKIIIVDEEHALIYPDDMSGLLHPTQAGYNKMAGPWFSALKEFLPVCMEVAPLFTSTPITVTPVGHPYVYDADASGNPVPAYTLNKGIADAPAWMNIDSITGITSGTPGASGVYSVEIHADNGIGTPATQSYTLNVVDCPSDMSHYWKLDETGGSPYKDFYGDDATCTDCPSATAGRINGAQLFNGTNQVSAADDNTLDWDAADSFSIEVWMKTDPASTCSGDQVIVGRNDDSSQLQWWIGCWDTSGQAALVLIDKSGDSAILSGTKELTDGNWHHIAAVRDAGTGVISLYVDGQQESTTTITYNSGFDSATAALNIGWLHRDAGYHFIGSIDEVATYNRPLSGLEISQHYTYGISNAGYCEDIAPTIVSSPILTGTTGVPYTYDVDAMGNPAPTYSLLPGYPVGMTIDSTTGLIQWTPSAAVDVSVTVRASNGVGTPADQGFTIHVDASVAPTITTTPVTTVYVGKPYQYDVNATGYPAPTYSLLDGYPVGMTIDSTTGLIQWTPSAAGDVSVTVRASNVAGYNDQPFTISVAVVPPLPAGMIHYWKLDELSSPYKDLYGIDNATCTNCPTATTGIIGGAQEFAGTNQVSAADDNTFDWGATDSFSIEFWMKTDAASTCSGDQVIMGRSDGATPLQWWIGCSDGGAAAFVLKDKNGDIAILNGSTDLTDGQWHHIVAVRDAGTNKVRLYVDAVEETSVDKVYTADLILPLPP